MRVEEGSQVHMSCLFAATDGDNPRLCHPGVLGAIVQGGSVEVWSPSDSAAAIWGIVSHPCCSALIALRRASRQGSPWRAGATDSLPGWIGRKGHDCCGTHSDSDSESRPLRSLPGHSGSQHHSLRPTWRRQRDLLKTSMGSCSRPSPACASRKRQVLWEMLHHVSDDANPAA